MKGLNAFWKHLVFPVRLFFLCVYFTAHISFVMTTDTCRHMWSMLSPSNMRDRWLSSWTGPHPELTVAAAVLVLLVIVIISLIVLVVIWKQVLAAIILHSFSHVHSHLVRFLTSLCIRKTYFLEWISKIKPEFPSLCFQIETAVLKVMILAAYYNKQTVIYLEFQLWTVFCCLLWLVKGCSLIK